MSHPPEGNRRDLAPAVTRAMRVLDVVGDSMGRALALSEIAKAIGAPKSSTSNLCTALEESGMLRRHADGRYSLGRRTVELGAAYVASFDQVQEFHRLCLESPALSRELVKIALLDGTEVVYLARHEGRPPLQFSARVGARFPAASTAVGNILLSLLDDAEIRTRFDRPGAFPRWTENSVTGIEQLLEKVAVARRNGHAVDDAAVLPGIEGLAVALPSEATYGTMLGLGVSFDQATTTDAQRAELLSELRELRDRLVNPESIMVPTGRR
ncbi:IclR family transcriptional regulator [Saccharopolyspora shandongensis]|uniref:IclR family transcriptional regulator n=1 Tax=Saccharopolyspora shandongensis TaxID=418495 RepID=UPI00342DC4B8